MRYPAALFAFASTPVLLLAHAGHVHHMMGTVQAVDARHIEIKDLDGKLASCLITPETRFLREGTLVTVPGIWIGERVMIEAEEKKEGMIALKVRLGKAD